MLGEHRLRVELHAPEGQAPVPQGHDLALGRRGHDLEARGQAFPGHEQRVVARGLERAGQAGEDPLAGMVDGRRLPVPGTAGADHLAAHGRAQALVAQADAEDRDPGAEAHDHVVGDPRLARRAGPRGDDDVARGQGGDLGERDRVVAVDGGRFAQLAHVARQVVDEGVVVIDQQDHGALQRRHHPPRLVERLLVLPLRVRVGHDASAHLEVAPAPLDDEGADRDVRVDGAPEGEVADGASVDAAAGGLQLGDDLHGPHLRGPGDGAAGPGGPQQVDRSQAGSQAPDHRRDQVVHGGVALDPAQLGDLDRVVAADLREVVAEEVHDHDVLGPVLLALEERFARAPSRAAASSRGETCP